MTYEPPTLLIVVELYVDIAELNRIRLGVLEVQTDKITSLPVALWTNNERSRR